MNRGHDGPCNMTGLLGLYVYLAKLAVKSWSSRDTNRRRKRRPKRVKGAVQLWPTTRGQQGFRVSKIRPYSHHSPNKNNICTIATLRNMCWRHVQEEDPGPDPFQACSRAVFWSSHSLERQSDNRITDHWGSLVLWQVMFPKTWFLLGWAVTVSKQWVLAICWLCHHTGMPGGLSKTFERHAIIYRYLVPQSCDKTLGWWPDAERSWQCWGGGTGWAAGRLGGLGLRNGSCRCGLQCRCVLNIIRHLFKEQRVRCQSLSKQVISTFFLFSEFLHGLWPLNHERLGCLKVLQDPDQAVSLGSEADFRWIMPFSTLFNPTGSKRVLWYASVGLWYASNASGWSSPDLNTVRLSRSLIKAFLRSDGTFGGETAGVYSYVAATCSY